MSTGTLTGTYKKADGTAQRGTVYINPSVDVVRDATGNVIMSGSVGVPLVNGSFSVALAATDDATLDPVGVTYRVSLRGLPPVTGVVIHAGQSVDMADITPVDPAAPTYAAWAYGTGGGGGAVSSVNAKTGTVVLSASDVGADASGAAATAVAAHVAASDPHPQYLTAAEGNAAYDALGAATTAVAGITPGLAVVVYSGSLSTARPTATVVVWEAFPSQPTNMVDGDLWLASGGTTLLTGTAAPTGTDGSNGDLYYRSGATPMLYGPKASGSWPTGVTIDAAAAQAASQPVNANLTTVAGLTPTTDNVIQSVAGSWASRTIAQFKATLALVKADVGLGSVDNTADAAKAVLSATKWTTARTVAITGDLAYTSPSIDGTGNVTAAGTLATVNSNTGTFGGAATVAQFSVNGKGLTTAAAAVPIQIAESQVTNLTTDLAAKKTDSMTTNRLLGRGTASTGAIEEITLGTNLSLSGTTLNATGGGGSLTVSDEGGALTTAATTLDFVGSGVTASGTGATKTITIPGGSGLAIEPTTAPPSTNTTGSVLGTSVNAAHADHTHSMAAHDHTTTAKGGTLGLTALSATGTPSSTTFLRGDNTWATPAGGAGVNYDRAALLGPAGTIRANLDRTAVGMGSLATTSGTVYLSLIYLYAGDILTAVNMRIGPTTAISVGTHSWGVLTDASRNVVAVSADDTTATTAINTVKTWSFSPGTYTVPTSGIYYVGYMQAASTLSALGANVMPAASMGIAPISAGSSSTAQTTPPTVSTTLTALTAVANLVPYVWLT